MGCHFSIVNVTFVYPLNSDRDISVTRQNVRCMIEPKKSLGARIDIQSNVKDTFVPYSEKETYIVMTKNIFSFNKNLSSENFSLVLVLL